MLVPESCGQIFPDKIHNAVSPVAKVTHSPRALRTKRRCRFCSEADQRNEFPPLPTAELRMLLGLQDVNLRPEFVSNELSSSKFPVQSLRDASRHKARSIAPETRDFLHNSRAEISGFLLRHQENRFHSGIKFSIHQRTF